MPADPPATRSGDRRRIHVDGYDVDDDPGRVDRDVVVEFLSTEAYWGMWRAREDMIRQIDGAWRLVGAYQRSSGAMVGFARAVSDGVSIAYLTDVFVAPAHRGLRLGRALLSLMIDDGPGADLRWLLHTCDAHGLYADHGFAAPDHTLMERPSGPSRRNA